MDKKSNTKKLPRKLLSAAMASVFMLSLSACNSNKENKLFEDGVYAESGNYQILKSELWEELKWNVHEEIANQSSNVVLNEYISKITLVMKNNYEGLNEDEKSIFKDKEEYSSLYTEYKERLAIYAFQDVFNLTFKIDLGFDEIESFSDILIKTSQVQYADEIFSSYGIEEINNKTIAELVDVEDENKMENFATLANGLPELYYPVLAQELLTKDAILDEIAEYEEENGSGFDAEDEKIGYFSTSQYVSKFESLYGNQFDINAVMIRFNSTDEYNDTLRAFGLKVNNKKLYYIDGKDMTYSEYCDYYDDFSFSTQEAWNLTDNSPKAILEIYIQIYNYIYGGYKSKLETNLTLPAADQLNSLRTITGEIVKAYTEKPDELYEACVDTLIENNEAATTFTREYLDDISTTFSTYMYETLSLDDTNLPYSIASQSANNAYYIAYKFNECEDEFDNIYTKGLTDDEIVDILLDENNIIFI